MSVIVNIGGEGRAGFDGAGRIRIVDAARGDRGGLYRGRPAIEEVAVETKACLEGRILLVVTRANEKKNMGTEMIVSRTIENRKNRVGKNHEPVGSPFANTNLPPSC